MSRFYSISVTVQRTRPLTHKEYKEIIKVFDKLWDRNGERFNKGECVLTGCGIACISTGIGGCRI